TTMTRMVEEQRTQIGALKALGFSRLAISKKYLGYAFAASLSGSLLGLILGCTLIPMVIANAFRILYDIPGLELKPQPGLCIAAVAAAVLCTTGAALWACLSTLMDTPANLMRPKAPKAGRRVFLEHITPLWSRLTFTWKVTMRNLFRYQKRFWMTVIGIGGCTALIVTGFGLHDSIFAILDKQFDEVSVYDATVGLDAHITDEEMGKATYYLDDNENVDRWLSCRQITADVSAGNLTNTAYLFAVEDQEAFRQLIDLRERKSGDHVEISSDGVVITEKLSELLDLQVGDTITLEGNRRVEAAVTAIAENYVRHYVYMTEDFYEELFQEPAKENVILLAYGDGVDAGSQDDTSVALMKLDGVSSYSNIGTIRASFTDSMSAIDYAVIIIIVAAAALAFVVLYNLTNINITERVRELATLKVLGFYDREISAYVYRENIFLTIFGILLGLVMGRFLHAWLVLTVEIDMVMFGRTAPAYAYLLAAALTALFSVIVNVAAHFRLKKVDMVESLKTTE
ncbi:MAG: ABC transporter permease, partial [Evtepia sp.]